jgi:hypothetical protein
LYKYIYIYIYIYKKIRNYVISELFKKIKKKVLFYKNIKNIFIIKLKYYKILYFITKYIKLIFKTKMDLKNNFLYNKIQKNIQITNNN